MSDINEREHEAEITDLNDHISEQQKEIITTRRELFLLREEAGVLRRELCADHHTFEDGKKAMKLAREKIATLRRALEKAAVSMVEHVGCPMEMYGWTWEQGCPSKCVMNGDAIDMKKCWLKYFMEETK